MEREILHWFRVRHITFQLCVNIFREITLKKENVFLFFLLKLSRELENHELLGRRNLVEIF